MQKFTELVSEVVGSEQYTTHWATILLAPSASAVGVLPSNTRALR